MSYQNPFDSYGQDYLSSLNNAYKASDATPRGGLLPEGKYQGYVSSVAFVPNKFYNDELQFNLKLTVLDGPKAGFSITKFYTLTPERIDMLKGDMLTLGVNLDNGVEQLGEQEVLEGLLDTVVDFTIKHKKRTKGDGVYQNIYINRAAGKVSGFVPMPEDDDDDPFKR